MRWLLQILLSDAAGAAVLAAVVWLAGLLCRRPAVVRALWILVLLKLLTPPLWTVPVQRLITRDKPAEPVIPTRVEAAPDAADAALLPMIAPAVAPLVPAREPVSVASIALHWMPIIWLAVSAGLVLTGLARAWSLRRILKLAAPAEAALQWQTAALAGRLGLDRVPQVWLVPGVVCPALWAFGRAARIIVPLDLWNRLDEAQRKSVLAHELAHLRRGDHWVRLLELVTTIVYWWHPAVWVARRQIHDCEEQCCDAWVLWALPASAHSYGAALLEAVDFVSTRHPSRPALAAGLGEFRHLKRRLLMIKQQSVARALSRTGFLTICSAAALALPVGPILGQALPPAGEQRSADEAEAAARSERDIAEARARVGRLAAQLAEAQSRLALLEQAAGLPPSAPMGLPRGGMGMAGALPPGAPSNRSPGAAGIGAGTPAPGMQPGMPRTGSFGGGGGTTSAGGGTFGGGAMGGVGSSSGGLGGGGFGGGVASGRIRTPEDRRLDRLEKQLQELMQQVRELKDQKGGESHEPPQPAAPAGPAQPPVGF